MIQESYERVQAKPVTRPVGVMVHGWGWRSKWPIGRHLAESWLATTFGLLVLIIFFAWEMRSAPIIAYASYASDSDEGIYVVSAQLLLKGYVLFRDVFSSQPAFFLPSLAAVLRVVGDPVIGGHIYEALFGLATLVGVFWMAWTAYRPLAGPLAAALLAVTPGFLLYAHAIVAEMPMLGLCTLAVAVGQSYYLSSGRGKAGLIGLLLMAGTEMKLLSVMMVPPLALLLMGGARRGYRAGRSWRALAIDGATVALCFAVPALLVLVTFAPAEQLSQVITFHIAASRALPLDGRMNWDHLGGFLSRYDPGLLVIAGVGIGMSLFRAHRQYLPLVYTLWFLTSFVFLLRYHPLAQHQFLPLLPPLALLGAALISPWTSTVGGREYSAGQEVLRWIGKRGYTSVKFRRGITGFAAAAYLALLGLRTIPIDSHLFTPSTMPRRDPLIALLDDKTRPGDFVVCDDPMVALGARRLLPPGLEDLSLVRTAAGYLTASDAIATTRRYQPAAIVLSHPAQADVPFTYLEWVARHYHRVPSPVRGAQVYLLR